MAIGLENYPNIDGPDSSYPDGKIRDRNGSTQGTPVNTEVYGDAHQFFAKLLREAGIEPNGLPDNEYSGNQYWDALLSLIENKITPESWRTVGGPGEAGFLNGWINYVPGTLDFNVVQFKQDGNNCVHIRGVVTAGTDGSGIFILPNGYRPLKDTVIPRQQFESSAFVSGYVVITKTGSVYYSGAANDAVYLDGISFFVD